MSDRSDRFSRLTERLLPRLGAQLRGIGRQLVPAVQLARLDASVLRAWGSRIGPVRDALGAATGMGYTRLVLAIAEQDADVARIVAYTLPDHLARVEEGQRARYLSLLRAVQRDRLSALPLVVRTLPDLLERLDDENLARYLAQGLQLHQQSARKAESFFKLESHEGQRAVEDLRKGVPLSTVRRTLTLYARAHCGEDVQIRGGGDRAFTDGRHLYLPEMVEQFGDDRDFLVYRVLTARNAGYLEFGTLNLDLDQLPEKDWPTRRTGELELERLERGFTNSVLARDLFSLFENARIEARVRAEYPGIARDMDALEDQWRPTRPALDSLTPVEQAVEWLYRYASRRHRAHPLPPLPEARAQQVAQAIAAQLDVLSADPDASVHDTVQAVLQAYPSLEALMRRVQDEDLRPIDPETGTPQGGEGPARGSQDPASSPEVERPRPRGEADRAGPDLQTYRPMQDDPLSGALETGQLSAEDRATEAQAQALLAALREDDPEASLAQARQQARDGADASYEEMAAFLDRLQAPAGPQTEGQESPRAREDRPPQPQQPLEEGSVPGRTSFLYPEWDAEIEDHKPRWVRLTEYALPPGDPGYVERVRREHGPLVGQVRRAFEALRPEAVRRVRGLEDGDEIDIDRAIADRLEQRRGGSPQRRIYARRLRQDRDVAVAFLLDMSSSTNEVANADGKRVLDVEKEALILIAEAVDAIGDACAIYGFSGYGRDSVAFYTAKEFSERWDDQIAARIGRISWKMENRDGAAIRHTTARLAAWPARVKLLLLLSDGKPLDCGCDHYADFYAQEDTRVALQEARTAGIHPFCITVDPHGQEYLARMYGEHGYTVIDRVEALPLRLPRIYRRLTR